MWFHRPLKKKTYVPEALCQWGLLTRWLCWWLLKALPKILARSPLTSSALLIPCSCISAHVLGSAAIKTVTKLSSLMSTNKYPITLDELGTWQTLRAMESGHSWTSQPFAIWLTPPFSTTVPTLPHFTSSKLAMLAVWPPCPGQLSREPTSHCPLPFSGCFSLKQQMCQECLYAPPPWNFLHLLTQALSDVLMPWEHFRQEPIISRVKVLACFWFVFTLKK